MRGEDSCRDHAEEERRARLLELQTRNVMEAIRLGIPMSEGWRQILQQAGRMPREEGHA